jgi:choline transport protein
MILSITINGILGLSMLLATLFCVGNVEDIITFPFPFMAIFKGAAGTAGGTAMSSVVVILLMCALIAFVTTASRMTWSFARDRGLPGWRHLSKVSFIILNPPKSKSLTRQQVTTKSRVPLISIALTTLIALLLALIILGSSLAFNDVLSVTVSSLYLSYLIGNSLLLYRRLSGHIAPYNPTPQGLTNVGANGLTWGAWRIKEPWGTLVNGVGCVYLGVVGFFSFWPTKVNPGVQGMNYSSLMLGGVVLLASWWYWVRARRTYKGPVIEVM